MDANELRGFLPKLRSFLKQFDDCFSDHRARAHLSVYVEGQLSNLDRKSVEPIAMQAGVAPRTLQQFLGSLSWNHERMRDRVQQIVARDHTGPGSIGLIDETSFLKKGTKTPGVKRQWCGHLGKVDNCVVTVHLGYTQGDFQCLIDGDLFLPESWDEDRDRCAEAGIPDTVVYRAKWRIALEQYDRAVAQGVRLDWLTFDEGYGSKPEFLKELSVRQQQWVAEVPKSVCGWLTPPRVTERPYRRNRRGRPRTKPRLVSGQPHAKRLDVLLQKNPKLCDLPWQHYRLDDRGKGPSVWEVKHVRFHPTNDDGLPGEAVHLLMARHALEGEAVKYFLSNAPENTPTETLLWVALNRHRVERCFQDEKSELGMDHYEGRTYKGLMRHLYLTLASHLFLIQVVMGLGGKKSGVDVAASASCAERADRTLADDGIRAGQKAGKTGKGNRLPSEPQSPVESLPRQKDPSSLEGKRHQSDQSYTMPSPDLAL